MLNLSPTFAPQDFCNELVEKIEKTSLKSKIGSFEKAISINDLREKEFNSEAMTSEELQALRNFDRYRIEKLNRQSTEEAFHQHYIKLQAMANLSPFQEFLKEEYVIQA